MEKLLVISNNVLSETTNNGKTLYSFVDAIPKSQVRQLFFSGEKPCIAGYRYFRISDTNVILGRFFSPWEGKEIIPDKNEIEEQIVKRRIPRNAFTCLLREALWFQGWKSKALIKWLDEYHPTSVFFHAGDCIFAHNIFRFIVNRYHPRASVYITDDYVMPRKRETCLERFRRQKIDSSMRNIIALSDVLFTVSENMREAYRIRYSKDSVVVLNMTESMRDERYEPNKDRVDIIYAGSLYYGREKVVKMVADAVEKYNGIFNPLKNLHLNIYTNIKVDGDLLRNTEHIHIKGKIDKKELIKEYNSSDILLFIESFEESNVEKTKYSLSTKVPEYLSLHKPILAVGSKEIASIQYLKDVAECATNPEEIYEKICSLLFSEEHCKSLSDAALRKYVYQHDREVLRKRIINEIFDKNPCNC